MKFMAETRLRFWDSCLKVGGYRISTGISGKKTQQTKTCTPHNQTTSESFINMQNNSLACIGIRKIGSLIIRNGMLDDRMLKEASHVKADIYTKWVGAEGAWRSAVPAKSYLQKYILFIYVKNICTSRRMTQAGCSLRLQFCSTKLGGFSALFFLSTFLHANRFDADELRSTGLCAAGRRLRWIEII